MATIRLAGGLLLVLVSLPIIAQPPTRSLPELEALWQAQRAELGEATAARLANLETRARLDALEAEDGWRAFASAGAGRFEEPEIGAADRSYRRRSFQAGLRYPLLGTRAREKDAQREVRLDVIDSEAEARRQQRLLRANLHRLYTEYWYSQARRDLMQAQGEPVPALRRFLRLRRQAGYLRASRELRYLAEWDEAAVEARALERRSERLFAIMAALFPDGLSPFVAAPPSLAARARRWQEGELNDHPQIDRFLARQALLREEGRPHWSDSVEADVTLAGGLYDESDLGSGQELFVGLSVEAPLTLAGSVDARRREAAARRNKADRQAREATQRLAQRLALVWNQVQQRREQADAAGRRVTVAEEALSESRARARRLGGDALLNWLDARSAYFGAARDWLDRRREAALATADYVELLGASALDGGAAESVAAPNGYRQTPSWPLLRRNVPASDGKGPESAEVSFRAEPESEAEADGGAPSPEAVAGLTVYLWRSDALFDDRRRPALLARLAEEGVDGLAVGLTRTQIKGGQESLAAGLAAARQAGFEMELLLGDPHWIRPQHRDDLLSIIRALSDLPFDRLHLDIEPAQLEARPSTGTRNQWLATLAAAAAASPWPVTLSAHPRWFEEEGRDPCIPCGLSRAPIDRVVLMVYRSDPVIVAQRVSNIAADYPELAFSLAQSTEATLPPANSYTDKNEFFDAMKQLRRRLADHLDTVYWQGWRDLAGEGL